MTHFLDLGGQAGTDTLATAVAAIHSSGLLLNLDAGDENSYTSGQSWLDLSGNGYDFFLGTDGNSQAQDPEFTDADLGSYFTHTSGTAERFTYDTTNETWMQSLHKDNAAFSCMAWVYPVSNAAFRYIWGTSAGTTGASLAVGTSGEMSFRVLNAGVVVLTAASGLILPDSQWSCIGMSINEATGTNGVTFFLNGTSSKATSTYVSPASGDATQPFSIGSRGGANSHWNGRIASLTFWSDVLGGQEMSTIYRRTRGRFFTAPPDINSTDFILKA